jgi:hypothetical protein
VYAYALRETALQAGLCSSRTFPIPDGTLGAVIGEIMSGPEWERGGLAGGADVGRPADQSRRWSSRAFRRGSITSTPPASGASCGCCAGWSRLRQSGIFVSQLFYPHDHHRTGDRRHSKGGHTYVVDIARLAPEEQTLVFGDVLRTVYGLYSGEALPFDDYEPPRKVIIFVDELNKYAPARGHGEPSPILEQVLDIAERGRSFGIILFAAQQFLSAVHDRVTGNSATKVLGRTDSAEINAGNYRFLDQDIRSHLTRLDKGELILSHPIYRQPVKIRFPRPPFRQGEAKK